jgi:hypothetical protein
MMPPLRKESSMNLKKINERKPKSLDEQVHLLARIVKCQERWKRIDLFSIRYSVPERIRKSFKKLMLIFS